nr:Cytochrome b561 domain containing protein [Haemonchus contortus]
MLVISQAFGGLAILLVAIWMGGYEDGFSWTEDPEREFHYHPTFMVMGMVFLYGESMLVYRVFRNERKKFSKTLHVCLHSMVLVFMIIALKAVWDSHDLHKDALGELDPLPNMISLHSWIGLSVVISYCTQYLIGFVTFFAPGLSIPVRQLVMPFHQLFGMMIFIAVMITVGMGISERAAWNHTCWTKERQLCGKQLVSNLRIHDGNVALYQRKRACINSPLLLALTNGAAMHSVGATRSRAPMCRLIIAILWA